MQLPITIGLHRSRFIGRVLLIATALAVVAVFFTPLDLEFRLALTACIFVAVLVAWYRLSLPMPVIRLEPDGSIRLFSKLNGEVGAARLLPGVIAHPWLTVFRLRQESGDTVVLIATVDSMTPQDFRRLRIFLRWRASFKPADEDV